MTFTSSPETPRPRNSLAPRLPAPSRFRSRLATSRPSSAFRSPGVQSAVLSSRLIALTLPIAPLKPSVLAQRHKIANWRCCVSVIIFSNPCDRCRRARGSRLRRRPAPLASTALTLRLALQIWSFARCFFLITGVMFLLFCCFLKGSRGYESPPLHPAIAGLY